MRLVKVVGQISKQSAGLLSLETRDNALCSQETQSAEKFDTIRFVHGPNLAFNTIRNSDSGSVSHSIYWFVMLDISIPLPL